MVHNLGVFCEFVAVAFVLSPVSSTKDTPYTNVSGDQVQKPEHNLI